MNGDRPFVVAVTGASGSVYACRLVQALTESRRPVHLAISPSGRAVLQHELGVRVESAPFDAADFLEQARTATARFYRRSNAPSTGARETVSAEAASLLTFHDHEDYMAPIASGSFLTGGMAICPCSGGTLSAVACGASSNLIHRAADVHLKERRPLILVPRETPLSLVHLDNLRRTRQLGAVVLPASPGWYHRVECLGDLIDFVVARILDQLGVEHQLSQRWGEAARS